MDSEKAPLLESGNFSTPTLEELQARITTARESLTDANRAYFDTWRQTRTGTVLTRINTAILTIFGTLGGMMIAFMLYLVVCAAVFDYDPLDDGTPVLPRKVSLEAHIMSKCPDAKDCLRELVLPAMQNVSGLVDFKLSYIGQVSEHDDGVSCKHGPSECAGNIVELCAKEIYSSPKQYLGFTMCLTRDYNDIPSQNLVADCALEHGMDFNKIQECADRNDGEHAMDMLRDSVLRSQEANVTKSCTIRLDDQVRCIHDGGEWVNCEGGHKATDLVADIRRLRYEPVGQE